MGQAYNLRLKYQRSYQGAWKRLWHLTSLTVYNILSFNFSVMHNKTIMVKVILCLGLCLSVLCVSQDAVAQSDTISFQVFYDELEPYGQWVEDTQYGSVWIPDVEADFQPYQTGGYWVMTAFGNTWISSFPWGWAPFHYGRWLYNAYYGWIWIPGYEWAPAWVCWRHGAGYYGWAPLGPWFIGNIDFNTYVCPSDWWIFISQHQLYSHHHNHYKPRRNVIDQTTIINNVQVDNRTRTPYATGPDAREVHAATGQDVAFYNFRYTGKPAVTIIQDKTITMFRPEIAEGQSTQKLSPKHVIKAPRVISGPEPIQSNNNAQPTFKSEVQRQTEHTLQNPVREAVPKPIPESSQRTVPTQPSQKISPAKEIRQRPVQPARPANEIRQRPVQPSPPVQPAPPVPRQHSRELKTQ